MQTVEDSIAAVQANIEDPVVEASLTELLQDPDLLKLAFWIADSTVGNNFKILYALAIGALIGIESERGGVMSIVSRPYKPDPAFCCERCIFGTGEHAPDCELRQQPYVYGGRINGAPRLIETHVPQEVNSSYSDTCPFCRK